jgi:hypothetical protein
MKSLLARRYVLVVTLVLVGMGTQATAAPEAKDGPPAITGISGKFVAGGEYLVSGDTVNCPAGTIITLSGFDGIDGTRAVVDENGHFAVLVDIQGGFGTVSAIAETPGGALSEIVFFLVKR